MIFFQQHYHTIEFFKKNYPVWNEIKITDTPHYIFCKGNEYLYKDYLHNSWKNPRLRKSIDDIDEKITIFRELKRSILREGCIEPIEVAFDEFGRELIIHGNHRASICTLLNIPFKKKVTNIKDKILQLCMNEDERYGTGIYDVPYQPVINHENKVILDGRRNDLIKRHEIIMDWVSLKDKIVMDLGCNTGSSGILCLNSGAKKIYNIDISERLLSSAIKLAVLFNKSDVDFLQCNLSEERFMLDCKADIAFCFSIHSHVNNNKLLTENMNYNLKENAKLIFETHKKGERIPAEILEKFRILDFNENLKNRDLYLLEKGE